MAPTPFLVDTNVLLRWLKPDDRDYPLASSIDAILKRTAVLCYTSQNCRVNEKQTDWVAQFLLYQSF